MTLSRSLVEPFLTFSPNRKLRKILWTAWTQRGALDSTQNNKAIAVEILRLRRRMGQLHGCPSFAHYQCQDRMAQTPSRVMELLETVWEKAKESANREREALESYVRAHEGPNSEVESVEFWDWRYYAEKVRQERYNFDQAKLKPYLSLRDATTALFDVSYKLFGLEYIERPDIPLYHPDVKLYEVREGEKLVALFIHDNFARPYKSSGAWMSEYRGQHGNFVTGENEINGIPIISNNNNFAKGQGATLLSMDDASTLFHEMGHGHHGMLSNVTYKRLSGTNVLTDFVELPSQLMEHWLEQPEVLQSFHHHETGESIPLELLDQLKAADNFNNGFETVEYTACALLDMALHLVDDYGEDFDLDKFEREELERLDMPKGIAMRHRPTHFSHLFASNHYAAGYYVYLWAEVLDADAFDAFIESGNIFDPDTAKRARQYIYSSGNSQAPDELFRLFRGRDPKIEPMLQKKGLMTITP
jgi:peptidyl-dipeptidase Dcp